MSASSSTILRHSFVIALDTRIFCTKNSLWYYILAKHNETNHQQQRQKRQIKGILWQFSKNSNIIEFHSSIIIELLISVVSSSPSKMESGRRRRTKHIVADSDVSNGVFCINSFVQFDYHFDFHRTLHWREYVTTVLHFGDIKPNDKVKCRHRFYAQATFIQIARQQHTVYRKFRVPTQYLVPLFFDANTMVRPINILQFVRDFIAFWLAPK